MSWGAAAHVWAKLKKLAGVGPKDDLPAVETTTFEYPTVDRLLPTLPKIPGSTTHTYTVITERVECSISPDAQHDVKVVIVDNVVKAIKTPCDLVSALAAAQLGGKSCARWYTNIRGAVGVVKPWTQQWMDHIRLATSEEQLQKAATEASRRRNERFHRRQVPTEERIPPRIWEQFIRRMTGLPAQVVVETMSARVYVETPGVVSKYSLIGNGTSVDPHMWALGQGPGDQRVYDLLNKHVKLNSKLVKYL